MNVSHIDLPRGLTFTVKEYLAEVKAALEFEGHTFRQNDANPLFWKWLMQLSTPFSPGDCLAPFLKSPPDESFWPALDEAARHLRDVSTLYGIKLDFTGIKLPKAVCDSTYAMCGLIADNYGCPLFSGFFEYLDERVHFSGADVISIGCEYQEGVFWALNLAAWLRARGSKAHLCIARHGHENFSLIHHIEDLAKNEWFFSLINSVVLYPEELPVTMRQLAHALETGNFAALKNIAIKPREGPVRVAAPRPGAETEKRIASPHYTIPAEYFTEMETPLGHLVYSMAMVRNKCFYKKCTFCVQITKHLGDTAFEPAAELERAVNACEELTRHGVRLVNFSDEAMRPVDLKKFCASILSKKIEVHWVGRMIAAAHPDEATLRLMREAGCTEILFGIEAFEPEVLRAMGKVSGRSDSADETVAMVKSYIDAGLFVILSMIYDFPTESGAARARTRKVAEEIAAGPLRTAFIFNRFGLFHTSEVFKEPARHGIDAVEQRQPQSDIQYVYQYQKHAGAETPDAAEAAIYRRLKFGLDEKAYSSLCSIHGADRLDLAHFFDYNSLGFVQRARHDRTLLTDILKLQVETKI